MDFAVFPPEVNSGRLYTGPGSRPMLAAAADWKGVAADLHFVAHSYASVIEGLTTGSWLGPSSISMAGAAVSYVAWLNVTAAQAEQTAAQAAAAAAAYETAFAMTVPPLVIAANRSLLMSLIATNFLGQNTPAIAATEAHYSEMWAQDAAAMYCYAGASATAAALSSFTSPPPTTNPTGLADQAVTLAQTAATGTRTAMPAGSRLLSAVPEALHGLAQPLQAADTSLPSFLQLLSLLSPLNLTVASAATAITSTGTGGSYGGLGYAVHYDPDGASKLDAILEWLGLVPSSSGTRTLVSWDLAGPGASAAAAPAMPAGLGRATAIGVLSVPPNWAASAPAIGPVALRLATASSSVAPTVATNNLGSLIGQLAFSSFAGGGMGNAATPSRVPRATAEKRRRAKDSGPSNIQVDSGDLTHVSHREDPDLQCVAISRLEREILSAVRSYITPR